MTNIFAAAARLPPESFLKSWKNDINQFLHDTNGDDFVIECSNPVRARYNAASIDQLLRVHKAKEIKREVEQELDWFATNYTQPHTVLTDPPQQAIKEFQSLIYSSRYDEILPGYGMSPAELSKLCCKRWLSSDHVNWIVGQVNKQQRETFCVYLNYVTNVERFVRRAVQSDTRPSAMMFIINVGKESNNNVFIGRDHQPGAHWTVCHVDAVRKVITYGDSLGWGVPDNLPERIGLFIHTVYGEDGSTYSLICCHDANLTPNTGHICGQTCSRFYPLQTCSNVCGVVAFIISAIACHSPALFTHLTTRVNQPAMNQWPQIYLSKPTRYSKFLRRVLMTWFYDKRVDISYILPSPDAYVQPSEHTPGAANVDMEVPENKADGNQPPADSPASKPKATHQADYNVPAPSVCATTMECPFCHQECANRPNLIRHMRRKHHEEMDNTPPQDYLHSNGKCLCIQCGFRCHRIADLRKHVSREHNVIFRTERVDLANFVKYTLSLTNNSGRPQEGMVM